MKQGKDSEKLINMLTEYTLQEIGIKAVEGITYGFILKGEKDWEEYYKEYLGIKKEAIRCGYSQEELFRVLEVSNGYIFDVDIEVIEFILKELVKALNETNEKPIKQDFISGSIEKRRKDDMIGLAKYVYSQYKKGNTESEVALFSRNSSPKIMISGMGPQKEMMTIRYNAYAIRHLDISIINNKLLLPKGIKIARLEPYEILPSKTGVKFKLYVEKVDMMDTGW